MKMKQTLFAFTLAFAACTLVHSLPVENTTPAMPCESLYTSQGTEETCVGIAAGMGVAPTDVQSANPHMLCDAKKLVPGTQLCLARATGSEGITATIPSARVADVNIATAGAIQVAAYRVPAAATWRAMMKDLLCRVNSERKSRGLKPLAWNAKLAKAAQLHTNEMANFNTLTHASRNGRTFAQRITAQGYKWFSASENVAMGYITVAQVINGWMTSPGHRANILGAATVHMGAGIAYNSRNQAYWTQNFASDGTAATTVQCPASVPALV